MHTLGREFIGRAVRKYSHSLSLILLHAPVDVLPHQLAVVEFRELINNEIKARKVLVSKFFVAEARTGSNFIYTSNGG